MERSFAGKEELRVKGTERYGSAEKMTVQDFVQDCRRVRGFAPYPWKNGYYIHTEPLKRVSLTELDKRILGLLVKFPLLSRNCIGDVIGYGADERAAKLYQAGILSRFGERAGEDGEITMAVYYLSLNGFSLVGKAAGKAGFPAGSVEDMTVPKRIELSVLSKWLAYTNHFYDKREVTLKSFILPDKQHPYLEALVHKTIRRAWLKVHAKCRFHILSYPKSQDAEFPFLDTLIYFEELARWEEQKMVEGCSRVYVVILCETGDGMEKLALELDHILRENGMGDISQSHFLYSLESDAMDELGAFKFFSDISFSEDLVRRQQVAFK